MVVAAGPSALDLPLLQSVSTEHIDMVLAGADFARVNGIRAVPHSTFNVGYIGTVDFAKMHPDFFEMSAAVEIPQARFIVCGGGGATQVLRRKVRETGEENRFQLQGYVDDIRPVLALLDVFGYPLCENNYSATDLVLQEVMYAGIPPVVLPFGGTSHMVLHGETGIIARDKSGYAHAIQYLYRNPNGELVLEETQLIEPSNCMERKTPERGSTLSMPAFCDAPSASAAPWQNPLLLGRQVKRPGRAHLSALSAIRPAISSEASAPRTRRK